MSEQRMVKEIHSISVENLKPYSNNARINDHVVPELMNSIRRFGFLVPIVITRDLVVVCGHTRLKAAISLGMEKVPCVYADGLTKDEINAYRLADNKIGEKALWDMEKLENELASIGESIDMEEFGFSESEEIKNGFEEYNTHGEIKEEPEERKPFMHKCPACGEIFED